MKYIKVILFLFLYAINILSFGILFHGLISDTLGLEIVIILPVFILSSIIIIFVSPNIKLFEIPKHLKGLAILGGFIISTSLVLLLYHFVNNYSQDVLVADYSGEAGIKIHLRHNGTYKAVNRDMFSSSVSYGKYRIQNRKVIFDGNLRLGTSKIENTFTLNQDSTSLHFNMAEKWDIIMEGEMHITKDELFKK